MRLLHYDVVQFSIELFKLKDFADEEVTITVGHFGIRNVNHVIVNVEVQLGKTQKHISHHSSIPLNITAI